MTEEPAAVLTAGRRMQEQLQRWPCVALTVSLVLRLGRGSSSAAEGLETSSGGKTRLTLQGEPIARSAHAYTLHAARLAFNSSPHLLRQPQ